MFKKQTSESCKASKSEDKESKSIFCANCKQSNHTKDNFVKAMLTKNIFIATTSNEKKSSMVCTILFQ